MQDAVPTTVWLFTDIEGSTRLWQAYPEAMPDAYRLHDHIIRAAIETQDGLVGAVVGDAFQAGFPSAERAVMAAIDAQRRLQAETWPLPERIRVRMAIHAALPGQEIAGLTIRHELGRVLGAAHGDQIIATESAVAQAEGLGGAWTWQALGEHQVQGMAADVSLHQIVAKGLRGDFPPPRTRSTHPHNLPVLPVQTAHALQAESEVLDHFERGSRLVTVVADDPTRAQEAGIACAWTALSRFPDGAYLVDVAGSLSQAIDSSIGGEANLASTLDELVTMIGGRQVLLVVSGLETTTDGVTELAEVLARCSGLHVIVPTTEPLRSRWERVVYLRDS